MTFATHQHEQVTWLSPAPPVLSSLVWAGRAPRAGARGTGLSLLGALEGAFLGKRTESSIISQRHAFTTVSGVIWASGPLPQGTSASQRALDIGVSPLGGGRGFLISNTNLNLRNREMEQGHVMG